MATLPPSRNNVSNLLTTHRALIDTLISFLTVITHHILYLRRIYPPVSFVSTRAYNYPVRQNRHPEVCTWINDAISAIRDQLERNTVENVSLCIFECENNAVLERWTIDLRTLPAVTKRNRDVPLAREGIDKELEEELRRKVNVADLEASFRGLLSRLGTVAGKMRPLPEGDDAPECSFTLTIQVKEGGDKPVGRLQKEERAWVAAEPEPFDPDVHGDVNENDESTKSKSKESDVKQGRTHAVRRLEAGELQLEMFVEESDVKFTYPTSFKTTLEKSAESSYGAGTETFDPVVGYDLEEPDINRKPNGGAYTDYQRG